MSTHSWPEVDPKQNFPKLEEGTLAYWQENKIFEESVEREPKNGEFVFYDGPPFATGLPHYGHILQSVIKDLVPRYKTMQGYRVPRVWGWDCHGLPVENLIEKELELKSKQDIEELGVDKFNAACEASVLRYADDWKHFIPRMGRWVDMEHDYKTMNPEFMESVWWVFKSLWDKELIYEGKKPMHICPRCVTPLSNFEVGLGYKDVTDLSATAKFKVVGEDNTYLLAWTTTPWTLPGNMALAVNADVEYVKVRLKDSDEIYILALNTLSQNIKLPPALEPLSEQINPPAMEVIKRLKGSELEGLEYEPLFDYYAGEKSEHPNMFTVRLDNFVTTDSGTGIVHIAPAFGEDDLNVGKRDDLPLTSHVRMDGSFAPEISDWAGEQVKPSDDPRKTDQKIVDHLKAAGKLFESKNYKHSYPHCWRCDTPLLNYATSSWFVAVEKIKEQLLANNEKINWVPDHVKAGRFGKWLEGARDWAISRNRYWGAPLPIWRCDDESCNETVCVGSADELEQLSGQKVEDFHKQFVDDISWSCTNCDGKMRRIPEVLDCWFESGSMPYAQAATKGDTQLPANFIAEAQDQTRGWFYTLHVLGTALFDKPAFENCITSGLILAEDGQKMSKSKKNFPDPNDLIEKHGADAMRLYLMNSPVVRGEALRFSERGVEETLRGVLLPLWNTYYFFTTYATADGWAGGDLPAEPSNKLDRWILSELNILIRDMTANLEKYELQDATRPLVAFMDGLTNWYIRRSRRRFWKSESDTDKNEAYATLLHVLTTVTKLLAPVCPFIAEEVYRGLTGERSVHLTDWPSVDESHIDEALSAETKTTRTIISLGLAIRAREDRKVRQPLAEAKILLPAHLGILSREQNAEISEELNVKEIVLTNDRSIAKEVISINARAVGPRLGKQVQDVIKAAKEGNYAVEAENGDLIVQINEHSFSVAAGEATIGYEGREGLAVASEGGIVVALDIELTPALEREGTARDLVRVIQDLRKSADYNVSDRIQLAISGADEIVNEWQDYICAETLAELVETVEASDQTGELDGAKISIKKA